MPVIVCYSFNKVVSNGCLLLIEYESGHVREVNQLYTYCRKIQNFAVDDIHHEKHLHCSLTVMSSSLLVLNNDNERVCGIRQKVTLDLMLNSPFDQKALTQQIQGGS